MPVYYHYEDKKIQEVKMTFENSDDLKAYISTKKYPKELCFMNSDFINVTDFLQIKHKFSLFF